MISVNVNFEMRDRKTEIKKVFALDITQNVLGNCVIVHYVSSRDGLNHSMSYLIADAPKVLRNAVTKALKE